MVLNVQNNVECQHKSVVQPNCMYQCDVENWKTVTMTSWFDKKALLERLCNIFTDGVEETMRNACCFVIVFPINK